MEKIFSYLEEKKEKEHDESLLNISAIGGCKLKIFLEKKGIFKEEYDTSLKRIFRMGDAYHTLLYNEISEGDYNSGIRIIGGEIDVKDFNNHLKGRIDLIVSNGTENFIVDIKSCSDWSFKKYIDEEKVPQQYIIQLQLYMHIKGFKKGILLFINKNNQKIGEVGIEYNKELVDKLLNEINIFYNNMEKNIFPEPCDGGEWGCKACEYFKKNKEDILNKLKIKS